MMSSAVLAHADVEETWVHQGITALLQQPDRRGQMAARFRTPAITPLLQEQELSNAPRWYQATATSGLMSASLALPTELILLEREIGHLVQLAVATLHQFYRVARLFPVGAAQQRVEQLAQRWIDQTGELLGAFWTIMPVTNLTSFSLTDEEIHRALGSPGDSFSQVRHSVDPVYEEEPPSTDDSLMASSLDAVAAVDDLRRWLNLTYDDLASMTGIAKTTFHNWRSTRATPRPSTERKILRLYALVQAVNMELGDTEATKWFRTGPDSPLDSLLAGNLEAAEDAAASLLFHTRTSDHDHRVGYAPFAPEPEFEVVVAPPAAPLRRADRRPRRGRLPRL
jgi:DNA-binding transcriptional regulator YiaG